MNAIGYIETIDWNGGEGGGTGNLYFVVFPGEQRFVLSMGDSKFAALLQLATAAMAHGLKVHAEGMGHDVAANTDDLKRLYVKKGVAV